MLLNPILFLNPNLFPNPNTFLNPKKIDNTTRAGERRFSWVSVIPVSIC